MIHLGINLAKIMSQKSLRFSHARLKEREYTVES